jgi:hypothetical protein
MGTTTDPLPEFIAALRAADHGLEAARDRLVRATVHETAFGRLFEARAVHNAYRQRLPETARDIDAARDVLGHFIAGLDRGRPIPASVPRPAGSAPTVSPGALGSLP